MTTTTELRALLEKAPKTPWLMRGKSLSLHTVPDNAQGEKYTYGTQFLRFVDDNPEGAISDDLDAATDLIVAAVNALPDLLSAEEELERVREELREAEDAIMERDSRESRGHCQYCWKSGNDDEHEVHCIVHRIFARRASKEKL